MNAGKQRNGQVTLVGAGPGAADLITLRGYRALLEADVVLYDNLIDHSILDGITAELLYVGKRCGAHAMPQSRICQLLAQHALAGRRVVRLKGGDPTVLGRGGEEALYLTHAGVAVTFIPGVSNAIAAPELAGIPVTHRGLADSFAVVSAHPRDGGDDFSLPPFHPSTTLVILMGVRTLPLWRRRLCVLGYPPELPVALITSAGRPDQTVRFTTVAQAEQDAEGLRTPTTCVIGEVVQVAAQMQSDLSREVLRAATA